MAESSRQFDSRAQISLRVAEGEAQRLGAEHIGTEHLLLGLTRDAEGVGARVLREFGIEAERVQSVLELMAAARPVEGGWRVATRVTPVGEQPQPAPLPTPAAAKPAWSARATKAIDLAEDEARRLNHSRIGTGHLLLGLIREGDNVATGMLASFGVQDQAKPQTPPDVFRHAEWRAESQRRSAAYLEAIGERVRTVLGQSPPS